MNHTKFIYILLAATALFGFSDTHAGPMEDKFGVKECPYTRTDPSKSVSNEEAAHNRACPFNEGMKVLQSYKTGPQCDPYAKYMLSNYTIGLAENAHSFRLTKMDNLYNESKQFYEELAFAAAETALERGCYDDAQSFYNDISEMSSAIGAPDLTGRANVGLARTTLARKNLR